jgi:hypothetical protein
MSRGRPKGYTPYTEVTYAELGEWVGMKARVRVSRAWWESITGEPEPSSPIIEHNITEKEIEPKIEYKLIDLNELQ